LTIVALSGIQEDGLYTGVTRATKEVNLIKTDNLRFIQYVKTLAFSGDNDSKYY
jgi:hypothetical protein